MDTAPPPQEPPLATAVPQPPPRPRKRRAAQWLLLLLLLGLLGSLLLNVLLFGVAGLSALASLDTDGKVREKYHSLNRKGRDKIAVISIEGAILEGEGFFKRQIDRATKDAKDGNLKAVVLRVNSPGGTVTGSDYMYHHLRELTEKTGIPLVVSMGGLAASGGYYVSMACGDVPNTIFAEPSTWTGSIGVIIPHYNLSELLKDWGIKEDSIASHRLKNMGSFAKPMTEEERKIFQELVDESFAQFKNVIKQGRPKFKKDPQALDKLATGQIYTAQQAEENGLIDKIGFIEAAIDRAIELAGLDKDNVKVVKYKPEPNLVDILLGVHARRRSFDDLAAMLELTAPQAYYLCTRQPPLAGSP